MTNFILIRHGEPDYSFLNDGLSKGCGSDLGFLSNEGIKQAYKVARDKRLDNSQILISSPYTRTMQTSLIILNKHDIKFKGETNIHEWIPDFNHNYDDRNLISQNYKAAISDFSNGIMDLSKDYESLFKVRERVLKVFMKYLAYKKIIVVTHGGVMYSLFNYTPKYCEISNIYLNEDKINELILKR